MCDYSIQHIRSLKNQCIDHGFSLPKGFKRQSCKALQPMYNGIGAGWMPRIVRKLLTWLMRHLEPVALVHDFEWSLPNKSVWHFLVSNLRFAYNAVKLWYPFSGFAASSICTFFGYGAYKNGKVKVIEREAAKCRESK